MLSVSRLLMSISITPTSIALASIDRTLRTASNQFDASCSQSSVDTVSPYILSFAFIRESSFLHDWISSFHLFEWHIFANGVELMVDYILLT